MIIKKRINFKQYWRHKANSINGQPSNKQDLHFLLDKMQARKWHHQFMDGIKVGF